MGRNFQLQVLNEDYIVDYLLRINLEIPNRSACCKLHLFVKINMLFILLSNGMDRPNVNL